MSDTRTFLVKFLGDASGALKATGEVGGGFDGLGSLLGKVAAGIAAVFTVDKIKDFAENSISKFKDLGSEVKTLTALTGGSAEEMSRLQFAADETGVSTESLGTGLKKLSTQIATNGSALSKAGIAYKDANGKALPLNTTLGNVAAKFASMPAGVEKNALAIQLFGKSGTDLLPILNKGKDGLAELEAQADKYGLTLTQNNVVALQKSAQAHKELHAAVSGLEVQFGAFLLPAVTAIVTEFTDFAIPAITSITGFISGNAGLHEAISAMTTGFGDFVTAAAPFVAAIGKDAVEAVKSLVDSYTSASGTITDSGLPGFFEGLGSTIKTVVDDVITAFGSFVDGWESSNAIGAEVGPLATIFAGLGTVVRDAFSAMSDIVNFLLAHPTVFVDAATGILAVIAAYKGIQFTKKVVDFAVDGADAVMKVITDITKGLSGIGDKTIKVGAEDAAGAAAKGAANGAGQGAASGAASTIASGAAGGALGNFFDLKKLLPRIAVFATGIIAALSGALETAAIALLYVGEAIAGVILAPEFLIAAAVIAVAGLVAVFHTQILDFVRQIPGWLLEGLGAIGGFGSFLLSFGADLITGLVQGALDTLPAIADFLHSIPDYILIAFGFQVGLLVAAGRAVITGLFVGALAAFNAAVHFFSDIPGLVLTVIGDLSHVLYAVGAAFLSGLWDGIHTVWDNEVHFWTDIVPAVLGFLGDLSRTLYNKGLDLLHGLYDGIVFAWNDPIGFFRAVGGAVIGFIGDLGRTLYNKGLDLIHGLRDGLVAGFGDVTHFFAGVGLAVLTTLGNMGQLLYNAGQQVIQGLLNGIESVAKKVTDRIGQLASDVKKGFTSALNIFSPSKDFHQYGLYIGQGLINGLDEIAPKTRDAIESMAYVPPMGDLTASAGGSTTPTVINNYITAPGTYAEPITNLSLAKNVVALEQMYG